MATPFGCPQYIKDFTYNLTDPRHVNCHAKVPIPTYKHWSPDKQLKTKKKETIYHMNNYAILIMFHIKEFDINSDTFAVIFSCTSFAFRRQLA